MQELRVITFGAGGYELRCEADGLPHMLAEYEARASLSEFFDMAGSDGVSVCFIAISRREDRWPFLVVTQRYSPAGAGFHPGILLVPETDRLFLGAGQRLLAYDLRQPKRLWEDEAYAGFWYWRQYGEFLIMAAELELAVWDIMGRKLWTQYVEPPWEYQVDGQIVSLDVMGKRTQLSIRDGTPT
jgi:hypothetical protein